MEERKEDLESMNPSNNLLAMAKKKSKTVERTISSVLPNKRHR